MQELVFESRLLESGHLYCPKEFATNRAKFKVIVSFPEDPVTESDMELAAIVDNSDDFLSPKEIDYYLQLDEK